ncbi:hypothetical protein QOT17_023817 [Balamuthia mandrillaris]
MPTTNKEAIEVVYSITEDNYYWISHLTCSKGGAQEQGQSKEELQACLHDALYSLGFDSEEEYVLRWRRDDVAFQYSEEDDQLLQRLRSRDLEEMQTLEEHNQAEQIGRLQQKSEEEKICHKETKSSEPSELRLLDPPHQSSARCINVF